MVNKKGVLQFTGRFLAYFILMASIITTSILVNLEGPRANIYADDSWNDLDPLIPPGYNSSEYNVILDQHSHTLYSDGSLTVEQNIKWHISMGYNAIVITDHNTMDHKDDIDDLKSEYKDKGIILVVGMEWTTNRIHLNFLGLDEWNEPIPDNPTDNEIKEAIDEAHDQGAVVTCNHILWSTEQVNMENHPSREDLKDWGVDFIEIVNDDSMPKYHYDEESVEFCKDNGIGQITGTDMHRPETLENGGVSGWTLLNASTFTEEAIMEELRDHNTTVIHTSTPYQDRGEYETNPAYLWVKPLSDFGGLFIGLYMEGLDVFVITMYLVYVFSIFGIVEVYRAVKPRFWNQIQKLRGTREEVSKTE